MKLVLASNNQKKLKEMREILRRLDIEVITQAELGINIDVPETGATFEENALIKARAVMEASGLPAVSDDSGLEVYALDGAPGVYSARYGAPEAETDYDRTMLLLRNMEGVPEDARGARFVSCICCVFPDGGCVTARGECEGFITAEMSGAGGFGYDPVFYMPEHGATMAAIDGEMKNKSSHRAKALEKFKQALEAYRGAKTGIFGGTFDPVHTGHISAAAAAARELGLDRVIFIPARVPPHKELPPGSPPPEERLRMLQLAAEGNPLFYVSDIELKRDGPCYTADTAAALRGTISGELWLLVGSDMFLTLQDWSRAAALLETVNIGVFSRTGGDRAGLEAHRAFLEREYGAKIRIIENEAVDISSSELRCLIENGEGAEYLPAEVYEHIKENGLYGIKREK